MEKQNSVVFRSSAAGYNKRDVNQFILSMNAKYSAAEEGYKKEISALKESCQKGAQSAEKLAAAEAENETLRRKLESIRLELAELRQQNEALAAEQSSMTSDDPEELEQLRKKAELYDTMSSQFGDVMLTANHNAERIVEDARREAEQMLAAARSVIGQGAVVLNTRLDELCRSTSVRAIDEIQTTVYSAQKAMSRFLDDFARRRAQMDEALRQHHAELRRATDEQIAQMEIQGKAALKSICAKKQRLSHEEEGK